MNTNINARTLHSLPRGSLNRCGLAIIIIIFKTGDGVVYITAKSRGLLTFYWRTPSPYMTTFVRGTRTDEQKPQHRKCRAE